MIWITTRIESIVSQAISHLSWNISANNQINQKKQTKLVVILNWFGKIDYFFALMHDFWFVTVWLFEIHNVHFKRCFWGKLEVVMCQWIAPLVIRNPTNRQHFLLSWYTVSSFLCLMSSCFKMAPANTVLWLTLRLFSTVSLSLSAESNNINCFLPREEFGPAKTIQLPYVFCPFLH